MTIKSNIPIPVQPTFDLLGLTIKELRAIQLAAYLMTSDDEEIRSLFTRLFITCTDTLNENGCQGSVYADQIEYRPRGPESCVSTVFIQSL